jgi:hypothetical protein
MERVPRVTVETTETLHRAVKVKAAESGCSVSDVVRELLTLWVEDKVELPDKSEEVSQEQK